MSAPIVLGRPARAHLRLAEEPGPAPISDDKTAMAEINDRWKAARDEYATLLGIMAPHNLMWLVGTSKKLPAGGLRRGAFRGMATAARDIAASATRVADLLQGAADVYDRREAGR